MGPVPAFGQATECPAPGTVAEAISVSVEIPDYSLNHSLSASQLTARFADRSLQPDTRIDGYADIGPAEIRWQWSSVETRWPDDPQGTGCVAIEVDVSFVFAKSSILYVSSDYRVGGSCYEAVLSHEQQHYEATMDLVDTFGRRLKPALENDPRIATAGNPDRYYSAGQRDVALDRNTKRVERIVTGYARRLNDDMTKANRRLDQPSSYERVYAGCTD